ncbi:TolC family protein [Rhodoferax sp.]|uniref:TolC family protein n=1 Tax=Rhodoferax sp. TaxID=50421 RepID=UPI00284DF8BF|nr:TolC family protein [Rhodoferax sp.]MDR3368911.1 TolC family protein [Rhodoferax sp.]
MHKSTFLTTRRSRITALCRTPALLGLFISLTLPLSLHANPLGDVLQAALDHPAVRSRQAQLQAAEQDESAAQARYFGRGNLLLDQTRYEGQHVVGYFYPGQPTPAILDDNISRVGISYSLPIDLFGVIAASREKAQGNRKALELLARQEQLLRLNQAASALARKQALQLQVQGLQTQRERVEVSAARIRQEVDLGRTAGVDLSLAESDLARLLAEEARLQGQLGDTRADLHDASGQDPEVGTQIVATPAWQDVEPDQTLAVRIAQARLLSLQASSRETNRNLLPALSVGADVFSNHGGGSEMTTRAIALRLNVPLDIGSFKRANADAAQAVAAEEDVAASRQTARRQWQSLHSAYTSAKADALSLEKEITYRTEVVAVEEKKWELGSQTLENLLRQRRDLLDAQYRLADARWRSLNAWSQAQVLAGTDPSQYIATLNPQKP